MEPTSEMTQGKARAHYTVWGKAIGWRDLYCCGAGNNKSAYWPNVAYFCPHCGEIWGRMMYEFFFRYAPNPLPPWAIEVRPCETHGDGRLLVGQESLLEYCSVDLLRREALVVLSMENAK